MPRTKQINVSIPEASVPLLLDFTDKCKELGLTRSEVLIELMTGWCADGEVTHGPFTSVESLMDSLNSPEHDEHASNDPLPEWMI